MLENLRCSIDHKQLNISDQKLNSILNDFADQLLASSDEFSSSKKETVNQGVQTDEDSRITNVLELVRANYL
jgi:hypothetical protein